MSTRRNKNDNESNIEHVISNDIWFHVANQISPEQVQTFGLICQQTAALIRTKMFWKQLYHRYCGSTKQWVIGLPQHLQLEHTKNCDVRTLRCLVIEALYYCHKPFTERLKVGYALDTLVGRVYSASWHIKCQCVWIMCFKFCKHVGNNSSQLNHNELAQEQEVSEPVNDWETLLSDDPDNLNDISMSINHSMTSLYEGVSLLIICCNRFIPFPTQILYAESSVRLLAARDMLSTDMRGSNLELDFGDGTNVRTTIKYPQVLRHKVLPWWHPDFRKFVK